jgi:L-alanine-DL-glutamate epimerase-like enolase superfamily enzyme
MFSRTKIYPSVLVELRDGDGVVGYGEAAPSMRYLENAETWLAFLRRNCRAFL